MKPHGDERWLDSVAALTCNGRVPSLATTSTNDQVRDVASDTSSAARAQMPPPHKFLRKGYFPKELPPSFKTASFAKALDPKAVSFPFVDAASSKRLEWTWMMHHSLARASHVRRSLGIPNPVTHWTLAKEVADNWQHCVTTRHARPSQKVFRPCGQHRDGPPSRASRWPI